MPATDIAKAIDFFTHAEGIGLLRPSRYVYADFMLL